ncbi:MAG: sigma 54-interacting transcriptional regulator, partial [Archangium sp.]
LDEVAELPLSQQPKLLRVLETRRFRPVGGTVDVEFRGRIVSATHANLEQLKAERRFREDLLHRLMVLRVPVPSLAERSADVPLLVAHFLKQSSSDVTFTDAAWGWLASRSWSGNVRELRNFIDQVSIFIDERPVDAPALERLVHRSEAPDVIARLVGEVLALEYDGDKLALVETQLVQEALRREHGNKSAAARRLGVHRKAIERRAGVDENDPSTG